MLNTQTSHPLIGNLLDGRYQVIQLLSFGVLWQTYIAQDIHHPDRPRCIIKHLKTASQDPSLWETFNQVFDREVQVLQQLGNHEQIPQVLATFADDQGFYLVQESIPGDALCNLLPTSPRCGKRWSEPQVIQMLQQVLSILEFIHNQNIIHCNINPNNLIKRFSDGKLFLIDFGIIQPIQKLCLNSQDQLNPTSNINAAGYIPAEQLAFQPHPNSDIYALGQIGIQALTGLHPAQLQADLKRNWQQEASVSYSLATLLTKMVQPNSKKRYQTAAEVLQAIERLPAKIKEKTSIIKLSTSNNLSVIQKPALSLPISPQITVIQATELTPTTEPTPIFDPNVFLYPFLPFPPIELEDDEPIVTLRLSPVFMALTLSLVVIGVNYVLIDAGIHDITLADQTHSKLIGRVSNEAQLVFLAEKICQIPHICFWQGPPLDEAQAKAALQKAYNRAAKRDFAAALKYLDEITPGSPGYEQARSKIAEYQKKQSIKNMILENKGQLASW